MGLKPQIKNADDAYTAPDRDSFCDFGELMVFI
jgi:hypothetical protein